MNQNLHPVMQQALWPWMSQATTRAPILAEPELTSSVTLHEAEDILAGVIKQWNQLHAADDARLLAHQIKHEGRQTW